MAYEFNDEEAENMWVLGNKISIVGLLMIFGGIIGSVDSIRNINEGNQLRVTIFLFEFLVLIVIGVILFRPSDNFKRISTSEGKDIPELMEAVKEFTLGFKISAVLIGVLAFLNVILVYAKLF
ncbi:MAG: hypothetical protein ACW99A_07085 [Candidatus Kariarchaeaceae archaeon]|jgi:hypothetical protein